MASSQLRLSRVLGIPIHLLNFLSARAVAVPSDNFAREAGQKSRQRPGLAIGPQIALPQSVFALLEKRLYEVELDSDTLLSKNFARSSQ